MIEKKLSHSIVKDILRRKKGLANHQIMHPEREWFLGLAMAFLFLCLSTIWSISLYREYSALSQKTSTDGDYTEVVYRESTVEAALLEFTNRKEAYSEIKTRLQNQPVFIPPPIVTPPLPSPENPTVKQDAITPTIETKATSTPESVPGPELAPDLSL